jgi:hypothetical protein
LEAHKDKASKFETGLLTQIKKVGRLKAIEEQQDPVALFGNKAEDFNHLTFNDV